RTQHTSRKKRAGSRGAAGGSGLSARRNIDPPCRRHGGVRTFFIAGSAPEMLSGRAMNSPLARFSRLLMMALALVMTAAHPAFAQDDSGPSVLRDTETELLFKQMSLPLIQAAGLDPRSVNVVLLNDPEINAFVATGQTVYIQSGLLEACDNVDQLQGVVAHELGHVIGGDSIRSAG